MNLYQGKTGGLSRDCYATLMGEAEGKGSVLEFGPGGSTLAFVEVGVSRIVTCEHDRAWFKKMEKRFHLFNWVEVLRYWNEPEVVVEGLDGRRFDLAFVDSPQGNDRHRVELEGQEGMSRLNTLLFALNRAPVVLLHDAHREREIASLTYVKALGHRVEMIRRNIARVT